MSADVFGCHNGAWLVLQTSSGWRPEVLLTGLQCTRQSPTAKSDLVQMSVVLTSIVPDSREVE